MKMSFNYLEIRFDLDARELQIGMDNRYSASSLSDFLKHNWSYLFSHELRGYIGVYPGSYDYADETCYVKIDWYGTKEKLQDIYYEFISYSKGYANLLRTDKYLEFDTCKKVSYLDTDQAYRRWISGCYHYDSEFIRNAVAQVKIEEPNFQIYALPGRRNGKEMIMANNNDFGEKYTKEFYKKIANNLYGYSPIYYRGDCDIRGVIKKVQINEKKKVVTIVWKFGEPTIARCGKNDIWDPEKGILVCIAKHMFTSGTQMNKWLKEQIPEPETEYISVSTDKVEEFIDEQLKEYKPKHAGNE